MTGHQQLHAFAQHQRVAHAFAVCVARVHQALQQITAWRLKATGLNVVEQYAIRVLAHIFVLLQLTRHREPGVQVGLQGLAHNELLHGADGTANEVYVFTFEARAE